MESTSTEGEENEHEHAMEIEINVNIVDDRLSAQEIIEIVEIDDISSIDDRSSSPIFPQLQSSRSYSRDTPTPSVSDVETDERSRSPIMPQIERSRNYHRETSTPPVSDVSNTSSPVISSVFVADEPERCETCQCRKENKPKTPNEDCDDDEGKLCPICFDIWTNSGEHRLCALRCGHLFGHSCLERWLSGQRNCPTCKRTVKKSDIRFIYAKRLIAVDTSELTLLKLKLDTARCDKNRLEFELIQSKQREDNNKKELSDLRKQVEVLKSSRYLSNSQVSNSSNEWKIYKEKFCEISKDGGCRVMDYYKSSNILVVSAQSPNPLFSGYGIRKVQVNDLKNSCYIPLHSAVIRDLSFHPQRELLLSVAVDKCVRLTETANSKSVHTVQCSGPIWSCCWDITNPNYFYVGEQSGSAVKYDIRKASEKLSTLQVPGDFSPVVSLASVGWCPGAGAIPHGGLIVCKLNSCTIFSEESNSSEVSMHPLCLDGPFVSMRFDNITGHLLVTSRPNLRYQFSRHTLCTLEKDSTVTDSILCNTVQVFQGAPVQKLLSRSCQMNVAGDVLVSAHQEANKVVDIWSVASGKKISSLPAHSAVLDLCPVVTDSTQYLCTLNDKKVDFFKFEMA